MPRWDDANHRILSYQLLTGPHEFAVQITRIDRSQQTVKYPDPTNERGAFKVVILTYDSSGRPIKIWDISGSKLLAIEPPAINRDVYVTIDQ